MNEDDRHLGREEAKKHGYDIVLTRTGGGKPDAAIYTKGALYLEVKDNGNASLYAVTGLVRLSIEDFSFPHPMLEKFEQEILKLLPPEE